MMRVYMKSLVFALLLMVFSTLSANALTYNLNPTDDTFLNEDMGSDVNYGSWTYMQTLFSDQFIFLKFDLSTIPDSYVINNVYLSIYNNWSNVPFFEPKKIEIYRESSDWNENTVTYDNYPLGLTHPDAFLGELLYDVETLNTWDITTGLIPMLGQIDHYLSLSLVHSSTSIAAFASKESGNGPVLTIEATPIPEPSTLLLLGGGLAGLAFYARRRRKE